MGFRNWHFHSAIVPGIVLVLVCLPGVVTLLNAQAAAGPTEHSFTVSGSKPWTDTGVNLSMGDVLSFTSQSKDPSKCNSFENLPLASTPAGTLIAKTSEKGEATPATDGNNLHAQGAGHLFLGINAPRGSKCILAVKVTITHDQAGSVTQASMKEKLSSAAQVFMQGQFGTGGSSKQTDSSNAAAGTSATAAATSSGHLSLPTIILDAELRKNLDSVPRRVHDHAGNLGDMVNFVFVGSQESVQAALTAADWHLADVDSKEAGLKAILNTYQKKDYVEMPMSHLYLFDRMQDFGYEQAQAFSVVATRHHFRLWKAPFTWNNQTVWVGAATHDIGFEKDVRTGKLTHKIDPNVDAERDSLGQGLEKTSKARSITYYLPPDSVQEAKNASGGSYHSDGRLLVVFLN